LAVAAAILLGATVPTVGRAVPLYARQTGQECAACHNGFPELTPYGRLFKLNGYTFRGGDSDLPPLAAMVITSFTHTQAPQIGGAAPGYGANNNFTLDQASVFWGGALGQNIGAFGQVTFDGIGKRLGWDNTDIRWAKAYDFDGTETIFGVSLNNNPGLTDVWNSSPAWGFPYQSSGLAGSPAAATLIEGGLAGEVLGTSAYAYWDRLIYAEVGGYKTLSRRTLTTLGTDPTGMSSIDGLAPYWRFAVEPKWGRNSLEIGTFGLAANLVPGRVNGFGTDSIVDAGLDSQYQFLSEDHSISVDASWIAESDDYHASYQIGNSSNRHDHLDGFHIKTTYYYQQTYGGTLGYFNYTGSKDALLWSGSPSVTNSPNSSGFIGELDYLPFNYGGPSFWPWLNVKFGLQYTYYTRFNGSVNSYDGAGTNATANDTLYLFSWLAF
jgi:hypothetical protein